MNHKFSIDVAEAFVRNEPKDFYRARIEDETGITGWTGPAWRYSREMAEADAVSTGLVSVAGIENLYDGRGSF